MSPLFSVSSVLKLLGPRLLPLLSTVPPVFLKSMWNVKDRFPAKLMDALSTSGFVVSSTGGVMRVEKYGCGAEFRRTSDEHFTMTILPTILLNGQFVRLWDAGYQKFLLTDDGRKFPAHAEQLVSMRKIQRRVENRPRRPHSTTTKPSAQPRSCPFTTALKAARAMYPTKPLE